MNNGFLVVSRELLERYVSDVEAHNYGFDGDTEIRALLAQPAAPHHGKPVAYIRQKDIERLLSPHVAGCAANLEKEPRDGFVAFYTHADAGEVERLRETIRYFEAAHKDSQRHVAKIEAQLAEARLLLREIRHDCSTSRLRDGQIDQFLHKTLSASAEPSAPKCGMCGQGAWSCNEGGCHYLESGSGEPSAPVERDERADITLEQVLRAYDYATSQRHGYLRGTTNWCAAVAHSLNEQARAALERKP